MEIILRINEKSLKLSLFIIAMMLLMFIVSFVNFVMYGIVANNNLNPDIQITDVPLALISIPLLYMVMNMICYVAYQVIDEYP